MDYEFKKHRYFGNCCSDKGWMSCTLWVVGAVILGAAVIFGAVYLTQFLWNKMMPSLFNLPALTWLQTAGIMILARLIFGGFGSHARRHRRRRCGCGCSCCGKSECECSQDGCNCGEENEEVKEPVKTVKKSRKAK